MDDGRQAQLHQATLSVFAAIDKLAALDSAGVVDHLLEARHVLAQVREATAD